MPRIIVCECTKRLQVPEHLAGKRIKCPSCGRVLEVPSRSSEVTDVPKLAVHSKQEPPKLSDATCPGCQAALPPGAVLCVQCGFDVRSGAKLNVEPVFTSTIKRSARSVDSSDSTWLHRVRGALSGLSMGVGFGLFGAFFSYMLGLFPINPLGAHYGAAVITGEFDLGKSKWKYSRTGTDVTLSNWKELARPMAYSGFMGMLISALVGRFSGGNLALGVVGGFVGLLVGCADFYFTMGMWEVAPAPWTFLTSAVLAGIVTGSLRA